MQTNTIRVEFDLPEPEPKNLPQGYDFRTAHIAYMYEHGIYSASEAANALGVPVRDVIDHFAPYDVAAANVANIDTYLGNLKQE